MKAQLIILSLIAAVSVASAQMTDADRNREARELLAREAAGKKAAQEPLPPPVIPSKPEEKKADPEHDEHCKEVDTKPAALSDADRKELERLQDLERRLQASRARNVQLPPPGPARPVYQGTVVLPDGKRLGRSQGDYEEVELEIMLPSRNLPMSREKVKILHTVQKGLTQDQLDDEAKRIEEIYIEKRMYADDVNRQRRYSTQSPRPSREQTAVDRATTIPRLSTWR